VGSEGSMGAAGRTIAPGVLGFVKTA
jgi:hypothetical protein